MNHCPTWRSTCRSALWVAGMAAFAALLGADDQPAAEQAAGDGEQIQRGRYLVRDVAQCVECHTPRDPRGNLLTDRLLQGAAIPLSSPFPGGDWAFKSPWIAGLKNYDTQTVIHLLQHGRRPDGYTPRRPMPSYRFSEADAQAVVAYLASLESS